MVEKLKSEKKMSVSLNSPNIWDYNVHISM